MSWPSGRQSPYNVSVHGDSTLQGQLDDEAQDLPWSSGGSLASVRLSNSGGPEFLCLSQKLMLLDFKDNTKPLL